MEIGILCVQSAIKSQVQLMTIRTCQGGAGFGYLRSANEDQFIEMILEVKVEGLQRYLLIVKSLHDLSTIHFCCV